MKELTLEKLDLPQSNRQCPNCKPQAYAPQDSYDPKFIKFIENIIRSLYLLFVMWFSSVNFVDSNIAPSCPLEDSQAPECEGHLQLLLSQQTGKPGSAESTAHEGGGRLSRTSLR